MLLQKHIFLPVLFYASLEQEIGCTHMRVAQGVKPITNPRMQRWCPTISVAKIEMDAMSQEQ